MKVVILAGGLGTRMREETEYRPKPMTEVGGKPLLWHIMKHFDYYGFNEFIICDVSSPPALKSVTFSSIIFIFNRYSFLPQIIHNIDY